MKTWTNNQKQPPSLGRRILSLPTLVSFAVAIVFIYFLATRFNLDWDQTWANVRGMNAWLYLLALFLYYTSFGFRGLRWQLLTRSAGIRDLPDARVPSVLRFSQLIMVGWFVNSVAWLRLGDAYRAYALSAEYRSGFSWSLGTVFAERVMDMATVFVLILLAGLSFSVSSGSGAATNIVVAAFVMAIVLGALLAAMKGYGARVARFLPRRLETAYYRFHKGALGGIRQLPAVFLLGIAAWLLEAGRLYFVVQALELSISLPHVLLVALGHAILSTVPTPGGIGAVEPGVTGLLVLGMARHDAVSVALVDRSITFVSVVILGGIAFLLMQIAQARRLRREETAARGVGERGNVGGA